MPSSDSSLQELDDALSRLAVKDDKIVEITAWIESDKAGPQSTKLHFPGGGNAPGPEERDLWQDAEWSALLARHGLSDIEIAQAIMHRMSEELPPFLSLSAPCAYTNPAIFDECLKPGSQVCSGCRLVSYCSKACQHKHWKLHSQDCKATIRSENWQPAWVEENRPPTFVGSVPRTHHLSRGHPLWGTMPATDILGLSTHDIKSLPEINIAFIGDLRNVLKTVNTLPTDYAGKLTILMNDRDGYVTMRNILMLQILARTSNKRKAADIALHFWYSAFIPIMYHTEILAIASELSLGTGRVHMQLGTKAILDANIDQDLRTLCGFTLLSTERYGMGDAANELARVRFDSQRIDLRHRQWVRCEPSHRLSLLEYNRFGIVVPFGAHNAHFNAPNRFLFSPLGEWLQSDGANPLNSWDIEEVIQSGKTHNTTREDLYGCLYFHVASQLQTFAERLVHMDISFKITNLDALELATSITRGSVAHFGISAKTRFDRIDVSNLVDQDYLGIPQVLDAWGSLLKRTEGAAIVGHFMNWPGRQAGAEPGKEDMKEVVKRLLDGSKITPPDRSKVHTMDSIKAWMGNATAMAQASTAVYDNSKAFEAHLAKQGLAAALKRAKLRRRMEHKIVPHRLCAPRHGPPSALPEFKDKESWYLQTSLAAPLWTERYIEIVPA